MGGNGCYLKSTDKIEPKFHKGDWIITNHIWYVDETPETTSYLYRLINQYGKVEVAEFEIVDKKARRWNIKDAKDGDVLCDYSEAYDNPLIFILKKFECVNFGLVRPSDYSSYCFLTAGDIQRFKEGTYHHKHNIEPATKEQRDLLFQKMKEAGYTFDFEKKELKKIEPKFKVKYADNEYNVLEVRDIAGVTYYGIEDEPNHIDYVKAENCEIISGYAIKENGSPYPTKPAVFSEQNPAWSEEDKNRFNNLIFLVECSDENKVTKESFIKFINKLKSLKDRVQSKQEWDKDDDKHCDRILKELREQKQKPVNAPYIELIDSDIDWLKSLKDRYTWKPSDEQMQALSNAGNSFRPFEEGHKLLWSLYNDLKKLKE